MHDPHPLPGSSVVVDGLRVHTVQHGAGTGLPIVLLHGLPTTSYLWHDVVRDLATRPGPGRRCIAPDLPGLGSSEVPPPGRAGLADIARIVLGLLNRLEIERAVLVGHDLGGGVAVSAAALAPERVAGLVLVDAPVHSDTWPPRPALPLLAPGLGEAYLAGLRLAPDLARGVLARALGNAVPPAELEPYLRPLLRPDGARGLLGSSGRSTSTRSRAPGASSAPLPRPRWSCGASGTACTSRATAGGWPTSCPTPRGCR